jgi:hypothetical protein
MWLRRVAQRRGRPDESDPDTRREVTTRSIDQDDTGSVGEDREIRMDAQPSSIKSSSSTPPSGNATAEGGFSRLNHSLRSVLFHPAGLPLFRLLNDDPSLNRYSDDAGATQQVASVEGGGGSNFDGVLHGGYEAYQTEANDYLERKRKDPKCASTKPSEETLTRILHRLISSQLPAMLKAFHQHGLKYDPTKRSQARTDILIRRDDDQDKRGMVLLLEAAWGGGDGDTELWWKKVDQNAQYLDLFLHPMNRDERGAQFSGPLLFAVLTMDKEKAKLDEPSRESAQLGVFLCAPRRPLNDGPLPGYRAALLWRDTFTTLADTSKGVGKTLRATVALAEMLRDPARRVFKGFEFLGPNCCRLGDKVRCSGGELIDLSLVRQRPGTHPEFIPRPLALPGPSRL